MVTKSKETKRRENIVIEEKTFGNKKETKTLKRKQW